MCVILDLAVIEVLLLRFWCSNGAFGGPVFGIYTLESQEIVVGRLVGSIM